MQQELILIRITGEDRPGLTADFMAIMAKYEVDILDIGQERKGAIATFSRCWRAILRHDKWQQ